VNRTLSPGRKAKPGAKPQKATGYDADVCVWTASSRVMSHRRAPRRGRACRSGWGPRRPRPRVREARTSGRAANRPARPPVRRRPGPRRTAARHGRPGGSTRPVCRRINRRRAPGSMSSRGPTGDRSQGDVSDRPVGYSDSASLVTRLPPRVAPPYESSSPSGPAFPCGGRREMSTPGRDGRATPAEQGLLGALRFGRVVHRRWPALHRPGALLHRDRTCAVEKSHRSYVAVHAHGVDDPVVQRPVRLDVAHPEPRGCSHTALMVAASPAG
jgi:hypothetical protein